MAGRMASNINRILDEATNEGQERQIPRSRFERLIGKIAGKHPSTKSNYYRVMLQEGLIQWGDFRGTCFVVTAEKQGDEWVSTNN